MFSKTLDCLTLSDALANQAFPQIQADSFSGDTSFAATARALLLPRIGDNTVRIQYASSTYDRRQFNENSFRTISDAMCHDVLRKDRLLIHNLRSRRDDDRAAAFEKFDDPETGMVKTFPMFTEHTTIRKYMYDNVDQTNIRVYTSAELKSTIILVDTLTTRRWHMIESLLPQYFKWYFTEKPLILGSDEHNLLKSLTVRNPDEYERLIEEFAAKYDMRGLLIKSVLGEFERRSRQTQLTSLVDHINDAYAQMRSLMDEYSRMLQQVDSLNMQEAGLREAINNAGESGELVDYFKANKTLTPVTADGPRFEFIVKTYLDSFDPDMYERISRRSQSHLFEGYTANDAAFRSVESRKKLLDAIFSDEPLMRIKICAVYRIDIRGHVNSYSGYHYPSDCVDHLPNPHLQQHACIGNHERFINDRLTAGDILGAIEQCVSSAKSLNMGEGITVRPFMSDLFNSRNKVIELTDGTSMTPLEALRWLEARETEHTEEE